MKKVVVITGAARGIGRATAVAFAKQGAHIVGIDACTKVCSNCKVEPATKEDLKETGRLVKQSSKWVGYIADQRDLASLKWISAEIVKTLGGMDVLFANAGIQGFTPLLEMADEDWHEQIDVNLTGTANAIRAFAPLLVQRGGGRIIITSSTQGKHGTLHGSAYSASKWGLLGLMKSACLEFAPHKITVNAVIPGLVNTPLTRHESRYAQIIEEAGAVPTGNIHQDEITARQLQQKKNPLQVRGSNRRKWPMSSCFWPRMRRT